MEEACDMIMLWNEKVQSMDDYLSSPAGLQIMAASCMLLESIGECAKKIDKLIPGFLENNAPAYPWRQVKGLRDHIAHGYLDIDAEIIFDIVRDEIVTLKETLIALRNKIVV